MKIQHTMVAVTVANAAMLSYTLLHPRTVVTAASQEISPVLRAHALEIVDEHGRTRAELRVTPALPEQKMPDGSKGYPETVLFRLITSEGAPNVKLTTMEDGAGMVLGADAGYIQLIQRGKSVPAMNLVAKDGRRKAIQPE